MNQVTEPPPPPAHTHSTRVCKHAHNSLLGLQFRRKETQSSGNLCGVCDITIGTASGLGIICSCPLLQWETELLFISISWRTPAQYLRTRHELSEISGPHGDEYKDGYLQGC